LKYRGKSVVNNLVTMSTIKFEDLGLNRKLINVIKKFGYVEPTRIQRKAIPLILKGYHTLVVSATGSGKTEASLFPIYSKILDLGLEKMSNVYCIYITPLRALNRDIMRRMGKVGRALNIKVSVRHGDTPKNERRKIVRNPPHIIITTPETFQFLLVGPRLRELLRNVKWVVIDELHELICSKRGISLAVALERLSVLSNQRIQRIGLSATIGDVDLARRFLGGFRKVKVAIEDVKKPMSIIVDYSKPILDDDYLMNAYLIRPEFAARLRKIKEFIGKTGLTIVFTNTRDLAEIVGLNLKKIFGVNVLVHHGSLSREVRLKAEEMLRKKSVKTIVATSSLELGIDIGFVDLVIQYGSPRQATKLIHRIGRSRHKEFETSKGIIITTDNLDDILESAVIARRALNGILEKPIMPAGSLDVLAHQIVGLALEYKVLDINKAFSIISKAYPYRDFDYETFKELIKFLNEIGVIRYRGELLGRTAKSWKYYYEVTMIPDVRQYAVKDIVTGKVIGMLDEKFVIANCDVGSKFVLSGMVWEVIGIGEECVYVKPTIKDLGILPWWEGELIPVDFKVAREVGAFKRRVFNNDFSALDMYPLSEEAKNIILEKIRCQKSKVGFIPSDRHVVVESLGKIAIIHIHLGSRGTFTLSTLISHMLRSTGLNFILKNDPYRVFIISSKFIKADFIVKILESLCSTTKHVLRTMLADELKRTKLFKWHLFNVAKRFGALKPGVSYSAVLRILPTYENTLIGLEALNEIITFRTDLDSVLKVLRDLRDGKIKLLVYKEKDPMPLTAKILSAQITFIEASHEIPSIVKAFKERLLNKKVKLVCVKCGYVFNNVRVRDLPERLQCRKCGAGFLTVLSPNDVEAENIIRKRARGLKLSSFEKNVLKDEILKADLVLRFGKYAVIALSTYGVGPKTAARVLGEIVYGEENFYKALLKAEMDFIRTRKYWDI